MGTLTMALAAALLAGSAPEKVSGETRQGLDFSGEWEGQWWNAGSEVLPVTVKMYGGSRCVVGQQVGRTLFFQVAAVIDQGNSKVRIGNTCLGIYRQQGTEIILCFRHKEQGYPTSFSGDGKQALIILHRIKPRK